MTVHSFIPISLVFFLITNKQDLSSKDVLNYLIKIVYKYGPKHMYIMHLKCKYAPKCTSHGCEIQQNIQIESPVY